MNSQNIVVNPLTDTSYCIKAEKKKGCYVYDTVTITVNHSPDIYLGNDTAFCNGKSIIVEAPSNFNSYKWSTGDTASAITISSAGIYSVSANYANGCISHDSITVNSLYPNPVVSLGNDTTLCQSSFRTLRDNECQSYIWNDNSTAPTHTINALGTYWVHVEDSNGCYGGDTITVDRLVSLPSGFLPKDTSICSYGNFDIKSVNNYLSYRWNNNSTSPFIKINQPGLFWLEVKDINNCIGRDSIKVSLKDCIEGFYVPTAFTPNIVGKNDTFKPTIFGNIKTYKLLVFNRFGQIVFDTRDIKKGWDGRVNGTEQQSGTFVWYCRYTLESGKEEEEKGSLVLIK